MIATSVSHYPKVGDATGEQKLRQAIARLDRGDIDADQLAAIAAEMTIAAIREQEDAGLDLVTDGQIAWQDPLTYICGRLEGFEMTGLLRWFDSNMLYRQPIATGPISWKGPILVDDLRFARSAARRPVKAVITGPYTIATLSESRHHPGHREFVFDLAEALNQELKALAAEGGRIQVDEPAISFNPSVRYRRDFGVFREAMERLTDGVDPGQLSLYVYHGSAGDIPGLAELPFSLIGLDLVQGPEGWSLLDGWPSRKGIGLGIVDARNVRLENEGELTERLQSVAGRLSGGELHVSPSCGLEFLPRSVAQAKLRLVAAAAHAVGATV